MDKKKILIVEDDENIINVAKEILELEGFLAETTKDGVEILEFGTLVEVAKDGAEALEKIKKNRYSLVISDYLMPRMNGEELYREIQKIDQDLAKRIIFYPGVTNDFLKDCLRSCVSFILKVLDRT